MMSSSFSLKYQVLEKIGEGSFSEVLKCQDRVTGALFAAKRLKKCYRNRQEVYECPEIVAMRKITRHPNILYIIETHYEQLLGRVTLISELLDMSIYDFIKIRKRGIPEVRVKSYLYQLLRGLCHLHENGIFHRDIKPENILIKFRQNDPLDKNQGEIIKLGDLGSIRGIYSKPPYTEYISTRWYRSPECLLTTGYYGPKMDVWAVGCVYYEILTLKPLFPGNDELDQLHKIHGLLGTPNERLLAKIRTHKSRNYGFTFPKIEPTGFHLITTSMSPEGRDLFARMIVYDPDHRSNVRRLLEHQYFNKFRLQDANDSLRSTSLSKVSQRNNNMITAPSLKEKQSVNLTRSMHSKSESTNFNKLHKKQQINTKVQLIRNVQKALPLGAVNRSNEKVLCGPSSCYQLFKKIRQPIEKKLSDPGTKIKSFRNERVLKPYIKISSNTPQTEIGIDLGPSISRIFKNAGTIKKTQIIRPLGRKTARLRLSNGKMSNT